MGVAYYIVLDREAPGFEISVDGKSVARASEALDALAEQRQLPPIDDYLSASAEEMAELMEEARTLLAEEAELPDEGEQWFDPEEGLNYFSALAAAVREGGEAVDDPEGVLADLAGYQAVLQKAREIGARWHLAIDF